ncbi:hypothetical protein [Halobacteriovorax sp. HLS]|uniref:hypothetical protein n=1 Tax=Halobacteriovorax sp. HLS TaxID=2234000 RepID=UPI000FD8D335|nr:hypothetical protein [Halobacteriovorax sp. HLS]
MNIQIDSTLMIIVILLLLIIAGLIVVSIFLMLNYFKRSKIETSQKPKDLEKEIEPVIESIGLCKNHDEKNSVGICAICEDEFCIDCLKQIESVNLCPEHFSIYASHTWSPITNQRTTPNDPNDGVYIYKFKQQIWKSNKTPSFILNEYKIQVENDFIETYVQLYVREEQKDDISNQLQKFKEEQRNG